MASRSGPASSVSCRSLLTRTRKYRRCVMNRAALTVAMSKRRPNELSITSKSCLMMPVIA